MSTVTSIEWTEKTWNPVIGCSKVSQGCKNCYAETMATRIVGMAAGMEAQGKNPGRLALYREVMNGNHWNGKVELIWEALKEPETWRKPARVFVNSMSDLFHEDVPFDFVDEVLRAMPRRHTFQVLTKRPERMHEYFNMFCKRKGEKQSWISLDGRIEPILPNLWLGVSVEDQKTADERIPLLLQTPAAVRWISAEPLLGPIKLSRLHQYCPEHDTDSSFCTSWHPGVRSLDWVVAGAESGPGARPMNQDWVRQLKDQCVEAGVKFFYKQDAIKGKKIPLPILDGQQWQQYPEVTGR